jgi:hypothetical protein
MTAEVHRYIPDGPDRLWDLKDSRYFIAVEKMNEALERAAVIAEGGLMGSSFRAADIRALKEKL